MKNTLAAIVLLFLAAGCAVHKNAIDIVDVRKTQEPKQDLPNHKDHDLLVYRETYKGDNHIPVHDNYTIYYYRKENDTLRCYQSGWSSTEDFNKASYRWLADTLASVRLYSSHSRKKVKFQVFGKHNPDGTKTSGISTYE